jgi:hypothetical protein
VIRQSDYNIAVIVMCSDWEEWEEEIDNYVMCKEIIE